MNASPLHQPHPVEGLQQITDLPPQDQAMDRFRELFPMMSTRSWVSSDGCRMRYPLHRSLKVDKWLQMARFVIVLFQLPLEASHDKFEIDGTLFQHNLLITYSPKRK